MKGVCIMGIFDKFNKNVPKEQVRKQVNEAKQNNNQIEIPAGKYRCELEKMELGATKDNRPMFKVQMRIIEGQFKKHCLFMNRVVAGTKNDMNMIASVEGWVNGFECDLPLEFNGNYDDFAEDILDIAESLCGHVICDVEYDNSKFNNISVKEVWDK